MTGSRAVMTPLAGTDHSTLFFVFACTYGSRFVSTKMDRFLRYALMNSLSRSGVHGESIFSRRMRASSLAAWRAWRKLVVPFDISPTSGSRKPALGTVPLESPLRTARSDSTSCDIERKKTHRTRIKMAPAKRRMSEKKRTGCAARCREYLHLYMWRFAQLRAPRRPARYHRGAELLARSTSLRLYARNRLAIHHCPSLS